MTEQIKKDAPRDTFGKQYRDYILKGPDTYDLEDVRREALRDYSKKIESTLQEGIKKFDSSFYVIVETKREKAMPNVIRNLIFHAPVCPTPHYGQTTYRYDHESEKLVFLWIVPDKEDCEDIQSQAANTDPEERDLLLMVLDFYDGTLARKTLLLNGEITID